MVHLKQFLRHPAGRATGIIFALCGLIFGTWASYIPYVKEKFLLDEAQLGLLLLCMPMGILIANPLAVGMLSRWGAVRTSIFSIVMMGFAFTMPILMPGIAAVAIGLVFAGTTFASANIAMNTCASNLEQYHNVYLMSACHGMWSLGAMVGGLLSGLALIPLKNCCDTLFDGHKIFVILLAIIVSIIAWAMKRDLKQIQETLVQKQKMSFAVVFLNKPSKALWLLISIILCTYITEGTMADWASVYMKDILQSPESMMGLGFAVYAFCMALGRFMGDDLIVRYGNMNVLKAGGVLVIIGISMIVLASTPQWALPGFMLTGLGVSVASPILYAAAARVPGLAPGVGLATMNTFGMAAFLGGPVLIGFFAKAFNLRIAFLFVAGAAVIWVVQTTIISRKKISS